MLEKMLNICKPFLKKEIIGPIVVILLSFFVYCLLTKLVKKLFRTKVNKLDERKNKTLVGLINNALKYFILLMAGLIILEIYGISTSGFIASLGVAGVIAGLALQDILKDILSGASIIIESQYALGDTVTISNFTGEVIALGLRTTKIKSYTGEIKIISNRNITEVINHSMSKSLAVVNIPVSYDEDIRKVEEVLNSLCDKIKKENKDINGDISCVGITSFDSSSINFRITAEVKAMKHHEIQRLILKEVKLLFDQEKIIIPYDQVVIHNA